MDFKSGLVQNDDATPRGDTEVNDTASAFGKHVQSDGRFNYSEQEEERRRQAERRGRHGGQSGGNTIMGYVAAGRRSPARSAGGQRGHGEGRTLG